MEMNMYEAIKGKRTPLPESRVRSMMYQVLKSIDHMHRNGIYHRDIKPENILITGDVVKLADFGSCRGIYSKPPFTEYISTRWYRPPECLLTDGYYNHKIFWEVMNPNKENVMSEGLKTAIEHNEDTGGGNIIIKYKDLEQLDIFCAKIMKT